MHQVVFVKAEPDWQLRVVFSDDTSGVVNLKDRLFGPIFEPLKDPAFFAQVHIDEFGVPTWPNGADLAPDALYETLKAMRRVG
jgi:hypothetical protein